MRDGFDVNETDISTGSSATVVAASESTDRSGEPTAAGSRVVLCSVFLLSVAALGVQVVWTRIFSFMIWYHFAFLVISVAMLGFTCGGLALEMRPHWLQHGRAALMFRCALGFGLAIVVGLLVVLNL